VEAIWLRWATLDGEVLSTGQELAQKAQQQQAALAQQQAELAQEQVTLAQQRSDKLATKLREMGINPDEI
jgi:triphosphoribosyl-dephospho-CoA synthetase